ncbi:MAG TPA: deoxynucleoside kinase [Chitinophagales bacterium]|nr:deoxynucleoside kinase [Chitinophagales bacterium]HAE12718.1 deoxynucleoside kinase [Bacteroidota bacterium]HPE98485.1 deoxynucleoside kinase [Chitinophagales bacterium]HQU40546.1 deoxynucleoside kinase [Chitinophagales bacterium]HQU76390.1 deoxynucleoside kinase [Chitinophagales bacterium]
MAHPIITVEGNIGSGKTSLSERLAKDLNATLILETFADNPFLQKFFVRQQDYALGMEMFFMAERYEQIKDAVPDWDQLQQPVVIDYLFTKSLLYAQANLDEDEFHVFGKIFDILNPKLPTPDLIIYLHSNLDRLVANIHQRGREFELTVKKDYLQKIEGQYMRYFEQQPDCPVLLLDVSQADFVKQEIHYRQIHALMDRQHQPGIHRYTIK